MLRPLAALVLAAGQGTRLATSDNAPPKVLVTCLGTPLLDHVRRALEPLEATTTCVVTGHARDQVDEWLGAHWPDAQIVHQVEQHGTGHAVRLAMASLPDHEGDVLVVYGDVPQLTSSALSHLIHTHREHEACATVLTGILPDAGSLGRIVRGPGGAFEAIVEARDAAQRPEILAVGEFNTGIYVFRSDALRPALAQLTRENAQGEEYATDAVGYIAAAGGHVEAVCTPEGATLRGVNDLTDLADAGSLLRRRELTSHMRAGVHIPDPDNTVIEVGVEIGRGAHVLPFSHIERGCTIGAGAKVGPFARIRGKSVIGPGAEIGNFVETKAAQFGAGAKAKHLTYVGDAEVGERANIGCGTITANYDGVRKHKTVIGPGARVGSGTVLVAPVSVGAGAITGANAVVLPGRDVPPGRTAVGVPARHLPAREQADASAADEGTSGS